MYEIGTVCSGIEAPSVATQWMPVEPVWFSEIEPFPCAVLQSHYPEVPNLGDMMGVADMLMSFMVGAPDIFIGGTPCQAFSVAGMRGGLSDPRGALTIEYVRILDAIDFRRSISGQPAAVALWENVPGVLSSSDNAFGCFLGALAGEDCELIPPGKRWSDAGCVFGPQRAVAWRILDAQYFGVAQRRRRVFVVASARDGFDPAAVLFEFEGVRRDTAPSREAGQSVTGTLSSRTTGGGGLGTDFECAGGLQPVGCWWDGGQVSQTLDAVLYKGQTMPEKNRFPAVLQPTVVHGTQDPCVDQNTAFALGRNSGQENVVSYAVRTANTGANGHGVSVQLSHTLDLANGRAVAYAFQPRIARNGRGGMDEVVNALAAQATGKSDAAPCVALPMSVRRLTPRECERLQGFPDDYTLVDVKGKPAADGPRYKALGNSMAVPVIRWIMTRILTEISTERR